MYIYRYENRIGGVMVNVLASSAVDHGFEPRSGQTKDFKIGICCFSTKHGFRVSVVSDVRERVQDLGSHLHFMLRRSSLVECVSVLHGTCLQCVNFFFIHQYVQPCLSKNPKYTFYTIKTSMTLAY